MDANDDSSSARLDKWLWCVRIFKTRALSTEACRAGAVIINGQAVKPARDVRVGEAIEVRQGLIRRRLVVRGLPVRRIGAGLVPAHCEDLTPPEEFARAREHRVQQLLARERGGGRPTKRDRRRLDRLFD